jgi:hypothetical protein
LPAWVPPYFWFAKGLAEYRLGNFENAVVIMAKKTSGVLGPAPGLVTAMALYRLGRKEEARSALAAAVKSFDWQPTKANTREAWIYHVLRREAEKIILPNLPAFLDGRAPAPGQRRTARPSRGPKTPLEELNTAMVTTFMFGEQIASEFPVELFMRQWGSRFVQEDDDRTAALGTERRKARCVGHGGPS